MKTVELFCASPASTAICSSMDQRRMVRRAIKSNHHDHHGSNRHHGGLPKPTTTRTITVPCNSSQIPYSPTHSAELLRRKIANVTRGKSSADVSDLSSADSSPPPPRTTSSRYLLSDNPIFDFLSENETDKKHSNDFPVFRSSSSFVGSVESAAKKSSLLSDIIAYKASLSSSKHFNINNGTAKQCQSSSNTMKDQLMDYKTTSSSPTRTSTKELIAYKSSSHDTIRNKLIDYENDESPWKSSKELVAYKSSLVQCTKPVNTSTTSLHNQVVELKVSIHCRGCEGKIKKHISRMEGVTSYSIDLATKKVTIAGNVTPLGVLSSVSKVKYAEFWSSPTSSSSSASASSPRMEI